MKNVLVLLVSDQTVPNYLFIKMFNDIDRYVFITTERMEDKEKNKREWIMNAAKLNLKSVDTIIVDAESKESVLNGLESFSWVDCEDIIVNVTGGTKMMSIAAYEFFKMKTKNIWYLPIGKNTYHLVDEKDRMIKINHEMSVEEYLDCCGIFYSDNKYTRKSPYKSREFNYKYFNIFINEKNSFYQTIEFIRLLFRDNRAPFKISKNGFNISNEENISRFKQHIASSDYKLSIPWEDYVDFSFIVDFFDSIGAALEDNLLHKYDVDYITGGWFEEYVYYILKDLNIASVELGVVLNPSNSVSGYANYFTNNDLDVVFVNNNKLYVVECKSGGMEENDLFNKTIYLASALKKYFGLTVESILCTMSSMSKPKIEKSAILGIKAIPREVFTSVDFLERIKQMLQIN